MSIGDAILGKPLSDAEEKKQELSVWTGVPVLGLDALASTGYGPEAALTVLVAMGSAGLHYFPIIIILIVVELGMLYFSYLQTAEAYPKGGGAYNVARDNFGPQVAIWAAVALMLDYLLNVAVGISAGVGAVLSAVPSLHPHTLLICLLVLLTLTFVNLRGVKESGIAFIVPVVVFVICLAAAIATGVIRTFLAGGHPHAIVPAPVIPHPSAAVGGWLLLTAFANGCTAMTGVEAVSDGVPLFRQPTVPNARKTLTAIILILSLFLLGLSYVCPAFHIGAMNEQQPGYQNVLSQLVAAVMGKNFFYYISLASIFVVLTYSAQTSFADFPRVCRFLAEDRFLPSGFATRGRRLVYTDGILVLAFISAFLLIIFGGITDKLIPLFAVGAFGAFLFSQLGMVKHWLKNRGPRFRLKLFLNALGACTTAVVLVIIVVAKFKEGAWITVFVVPAVVILLKGINRHYSRIAHEAGQPINLHVSELNQPAVVIPIDSWNAVAEKAVRFGMMLSNDVTAVHVKTEQDRDEDQLLQHWRQNVERPAEMTQSAVPKLEFLESPYRRVAEPVLDYVNSLAERRQDRLVAVIIPQLIQPHWYEYFLHSFYAARLRARLFLNGSDRIVVVNTPWCLPRKKSP
jgi:amino acid transporter